MDRWWLVASYYILSCSGYALSLCHRSGQGAAGADGRRYLVDSGAVGDASAH